MRASRSAKGSAAIGAITAVAIAASATPALAQSDGGAFNIGASKCGQISAAAHGASERTRIAVIGTKRVGCGVARDAVRRCVRRHRVGRWRAGRFQFTINLRNRRRPNRRISFNLVSGPTPRCVHVRGNSGPRSPADFGPYEAPISFHNPSDPNQTAYQWNSPVNSFRATTSGVGTVDLRGTYRNSDGSTRSVWFQYGKTRDLGSETEKQNPQVAPDDSPLQMSANLVHLRAKTRYFWRAAANLDDGQGGVKTAYGATGSFVTNPYPQIKDPSNPCKQFPNGRARFELTESLSIACSGFANFQAPACFPTCTRTFHGSLDCNKQFPRNLNAGGTPISFKIPEIGIPVNLTSNKLVSFWRSDNSNRFNPTPDLYNLNSTGAEVGPVPGFHDWDVVQWGYPFTHSSTNAQFWIYCTEQWGNVLNRDALAAGEGNDTPSTSPPGAPQQLRVTSTTDGGIDASWQEPTDKALKAGGVAGYFLGLIDWGPRGPGQFDPLWITPVTTTGLSGHISPEYLQSFPSGSTPSVVVGAVSREGSIGSPASVLVNP